MTGSFLRATALAVLALVVGSACEVEPPTAAQLLPAYSARSAVVAGVEWVDVTCSYADAGGPVTSTLRVWEPDAAVNDPFYVAPPTYASPGERPVVVYLRGTGWTDGNPFGGMDGSAARAGGALKSQLDQGWVVVEASYRLAPANVFPAQVIDAKAAVNCAKDLTGASGIDEDDEVEPVDSVIDTDRVVVAGSSSGGHLATLTALTAGTWEPQSGSGSVQGAPPGGQTTVRSVVNLDAPNDLSTMWEAASPVRGLISGLFCGEVDTGDPVEVAACEDTVDSWIGDDPTHPSASPIDWIPVGPVEGPSPAIYLACGDTPGLGSGFADCTDHDAMYDRLIAAYGDEDELGSGETSVWIDRTPGNHLTIDPTLNHEVLRWFLQLTVS